MGGPTDTGGCTTLTWETEPGVFVTLLARDVSFEELRALAADLVQLNDGTYRALPVLGDGCGTVDC